MPSPDTFSIPPIAAFVRRYLEHSAISVDPFSRNCGLATFTNDLNPETCAQTHMDAVAWLESLTIRADLMLFDPPYSPRQISECYKQVGRAVGTEGTQNAALYKRVRDAAMKILAPNAVVLSFGWNSSGMGKGRSFELVEQMNVCHGGAHNDTICIAERRRDKAQLEFGGEMEPQSEAGT